VNATTRATTAGSDIGALFGRVGGELFQQAWVVTDLEAAEEAMRSTLGCGEFAEFRMDEQWNVRGRMAPCALALGFARSGNMQVELIEPLSGEGIHHEFLAERGAGPHHFGFMVDDLDVAVAAAVGDGFPSVMSGGFASVRISYLDTYGELGFYVELIEDPEGMFPAVKAWRDDQQGGSRR
jgi:methylmalonyl-CoA/ethylmalonyl-CoA epimerase